MNPANRKLWGRLNDEADRFHDLSKEAALKTITGKPEDRESQAQKAREHLLRAETFREAAAIAAKP